MARKAAAGKGAAKLALAEVLDLAAVEPLRGELLSRRGAPLQLDGSSVQRVGGLSLQVLLSARASWAADGQPLSFTGPAPVLRDALMTIGAVEMAADIPEEIAA
jgi:chemotaxis protein CheX